MVTAPGRRRCGGRLATLAWTGLVVVAAGAVTFGGALVRARPAADSDPGPSAVTVVTRQTLRDTRRLDGELGYGPATPVVNRLPGTITAVPASGTTVTRGQPLYEVDNRPVVLMVGKVPAYRDIGPGDRGTDVRQLEQNLAALGATGFTVDDRYTGGTASAVRRWQRRLGLAETGRVELGRVVFAPTEVRVDTVDAAEGQPAGPGQPVLRVTGTAKVVTVTTDPSDRAVARHSPTALIRLPGGRPVPGRVSRVTTVITPATTPNGQPGTKIQIVVQILVTPADPAATGDLDESAVDVAFTVDERAGVLTVPVAALVALAGGGYGLEVVDGATSRYVPVQTGLFADGRVEVSGAAIAEGTMVGVPR